MERYEEPGRRKWKESLVEWSVEDCGGRRKTWEELAGVGGGRRNEDEGSGEEAGGIAEEMGGNEV